MMSSGLVRMAATAQRAFGSVQNNIDDTTGRNRVLGASFDELQRRIKATEATIRSSTAPSQIRAARRELDDLRRAASDHPGNADAGGGMFSGLLSRFAPAALAGVTLAAGGSFLKSSAEAYMNFASTAQSFQVLTRNKGVGDELANRLNKFQQDTILGPEVFKNAQTLLGFGVGVDKVEKDLHMLGDVSMGNTEKFQALTLAFSQTQAAGKLMGQDLLQYINAGFNPLTVMSEHWQDFGLKRKKSVGDLKEMLEKGQISAAAVEKAFELATTKGGLFAGMLDKMGETTSGKLQQLERSFEGLKIVVGARLKPALDGAIDSLAKMVDWTRKLIDVPVAQKIDEQIGQIRALQAELTSSNTAEDRRLEIMRELEQINPHITEGINAQSIEYGKLANNINNVVNALNQKKIAESIQDKNVSLIERYNEAQKTYSEGVADIFTVIGEADPDLAGRTDLTAGQKQLAAIKYLQDKIASGKVTNTYQSVGNPYGGTLDGTVEGDQLSALKTSIARVNDAFKTSEALGPEVARVEKSIKDAQAGYDKYFGLTKGPSSIKQPLFTAGKEKGDGVGRSMAAGGPRIININGVKFTDKIEIHQATAKESAVELQKILEEMFLRILNSGASVQ